MWVPSRFWSLRVGKFMPAYGIMQADHTNFTRALKWGEGRESYNTEFNLHSEVGEVVVTAFGRDDAEVYLDVYQLAAVETGAVVRATAYLGNASNVGVSGAYGTTGDDKWSLLGAHGLWGVARDVYVMGEIDYLGQTNDDPVPVSFLQIGYEFAKGFNLQFSSETKDDTFRLGYALQWFPTPPYEILVSAKSDPLDGAWTYSFLFHGHL